MLNLFRYRIIFHIIKSSFKYESGKMHTVNMFDLYDRYIGFIWWLVSRFLYLWLFYYMYSLSFVQYIITSKISFPTNSISSVQNLISFRNSFIYNSFLLRKSFACHSIQLFDLWYQIHKICVRQRECIRLNFTLGSTFNWLQT